MSKRIAEDELAVIGERVREILPNAEWQVDGDGNLIIITGISQDDEGGYITEENV